MKRNWKSCVAPKTIHNTLGFFQGNWLPQMDRAWRSNDGFLVISRLINTEWGEIEHAAIMRTSHKNFISSDGSSDISWAEKQRIKNEVFGKNRNAIEVYPSEQSLVDILDIYHLWIFPKDFIFPFGIHPEQDKLCTSVPRSVYTPHRCDARVNMKASRSGKR